MTVDQRNRYIENMLATYMSIGKVGPQAEAWETPEWAGCRSPHRHPTSNFAFILEPTEAALASIRDFAHGRKGFYVYALEDAGREPPESLYRRHGLTPLMNLQAFVGTETVANPGVIWLDAESKAQRLETSHFMVDQFFYVQSQDVRDVIAMSTAASGLPIRRAFIDGMEVGAALCPRTTGTLGLYNLCVPKKLRKCGYGTQMVQSLLYQASTENAQLVLQCGRQLVDWYERLGLKWSGIVDIWSLESP